MKKFATFLLSLFLFLGGLNAQNISGTVTDKEEGISMPGVNIQVKGTATGTITSGSGYYEIKAAATDTLIFSFIGYNKEFVAVNSRNKIDIGLSPDVEDLEEVVVVGYGTIRKSDMTGAVATVRESDEVAAQYSGVDAILQGRAAGVQVTQQDGNVNGAVSVRIRGTNSLRSNNEPLYVIDGVIINSAAEDNADAGTDANDIQSEQSGLTGLNMRDIESIEVLKDASATAIYGSRGANGVVLITTKTGKAGKPSINVYGSYDIASMYKKLDVLSPKDFADYQNEANVLQGFGEKYIFQGDEIYTANDTTFQSPLNQVDWQDEAYTTAHSKTIGLNYSGASEKTNYYFSANFDDKGGIVETIDLKSGKLRLNLKQELNDYITVDTRLNGMYEEGSFSKGGSKSGGPRGFTRQALTYKPVYSDENTVSDEDEELQISNPYGWLTDYDDLTEEMRLNATSKLSVKIIDGLKYNFQAGIDYRNKERSIWYGPATFLGDKENGVSRYSDLIRKSYTIDNLLTYNKRYAKRHSVNAVLGYTYDASKSLNKIYEVTDFPIKSLRSSYPQGGQLTTRQYGYGHQDEKIRSVLARANYAYHNRYIATVSVRRDESSKFTEENRAGTFPSLALAWRINKESFMASIDEVSDLKLRLGWGITGNSNIRPYQTIPSYYTNYYSSASGSLIGGNSPERIANPDLKWETTKQLNAGIDLSIFRDRASMTLDVYHKVTDDLLQYVKTPTSTGFSNMTINRGSMQNKGIELSLSGVVLNKGDFVFRAGAVFSMNRSQILELGLPESSIYIDGTEQMESFYLGNTISTGTYFKAPANIFMEGETVGLFYGFETDGIIMDSVASGEAPLFFGNPVSPGDIAFVDQNGDSVINDQDRTIIGDPNPKFNYGFNFDLSYKGISLSILIDGVYGNEIVNGNGFEMAYTEGEAKNIFSDAYHNAWREDAPSSTQPRLNYKPTSGTGVFMDRQIEDGSYLRLNNITLSYDLPQKLIPFISNMNIYASARNLFILTKYTGYNPQVTSFIWDGTIQGVDWGSSPNVRTFIIGANINF